VPTDVTKAQEVERLLARAIAEFGRVDILVNAAAVQGPIGPMWEVEIGSWVEALNVSLLGTVLCCRAVIPRMIASGWGKIINFSGGGATSPRANFSAYAAAKAAVVRLTETLAEELRPWNIQVNAIAPGMVDTPMLDAILAAGEAAGEELAQVHVLRSTQDKGESRARAAALAVFLASDVADGLTGRLVSAPHDGWQNWDRGRIERIMASAWFTLRRIDPFTLNSMAGHGLDGCAGFPNPGAS
jgi:3-oxoacyl-[acyl-carrier protein] reductase